MVRQAARLAGVGIVVLLLGGTAVSCDGGSEPATTGSRETAPASAFQLRPVDHVVLTTSAKWDTTKLTCPRKDAADCLGAGSSAPVVVSSAGGDKYVLGPVIVDGADIVNATARGGDPMGWSVDVQLSSEASDALASATTAAVGTRIAIVVGGLVVSAPTVAAPIASGAVVVADSLSEAAAERLASSLGPRS